MEDSDSSGFYLLGVLGDFALSFAAVSTIFYAFLPLFTAVKLKTGAKITDLTTYDCKNVSFLLITHIKM